MMTHRTRDNGRPTMSDRVLCHSTNSGSRTPPWATAHLYFYNYTVHTNKLFFPFCPPTPPFTDLFLSSTAAKYTELGSPLFRPGHQSSTPHGEISKGRGQARPIEQQPRTNSP